VLVILVSLSSFPLRRQLVRVAPPAKAKLALAHAQADGTSDEVAQASPNPKRDDAASVVQVFGWHLGLPQWVKPEECAKERFSSSAPPR
jgi:hypothetical protein